MSGQMSRMRMRDSQVDSAWKMRKKGTRMRGFWTAMRRFGVTELVDLMQTVTAHRVRGDLLSEPTRVL